MDCSCWYCTSVPLCVILSAPRCYCAPCCLFLLTTVVPRVVVKDSKMVEFKNNIQIMSQHENVFCCYNWLHRNQGGCWLAYCSDPVLFKQQLNTSSRILWCDSYKVNQTIISNMSYKLGLMIFLFCLLAPVIAQFFKPIISCTCFQQIFAHLVTVVLVTISQHTPVVTGYKWHCYWDHQCLKFDCKTF